MNWQKKGQIYKSKGKFEWDRTHAQAASAIKLNNNRIRIYFSTRDKKNRSRPTFIDVSSNNLKKVVYIHDEPILELGCAGSFDDSGIMPTWVLRNKDEIWLYYIGWNVRNTVPYHNSIGLAYSEDGINFEKKFEGPIIHRNNLEPYFTSTPCVLKEDNRWTCWYLSCTNWEEINGRLEPFYHIKYAHSSDGINWKQNGNIAIDYKDKYEGGISRPTVILDNGIYKMWYSYRKKTNYRKNKNFSYRIGYAESKDGVSWIRKDELAGIDVSNSGWDSEMIEYPYVFKHNEKLIMIYNGNKFGKSGFGYAELSER